MLISPLCVYLANIAPPPPRALPHQPFRVSLGTTALLVGLAAVVGVFLGAAIGRLP